MSATQPHSPDTRPHGADEQTDVFIVGAGPIGLELACELTRAGVGFVIADAGPIGATIGWWAPGTTFFSSPERIAISGVPLVVPDQQKATRERYLDYLRQVAGQFRVPVRTYEPVVDVEKPEDAGADGPRFLVRTRREGAGGAVERTVACRHLVLAIGDMHRPRLLGIPGEDNPHVSHYLGDPHGYFGRRVLIVGGKNSAVEAAIRLYRAGADVTMAYRRGGFDEKRVKYWLLPELQWLIKKNKIGFIPCATPVSIGPDGVRLVLCAESGEAQPDGEAQTFAADDVLLLTGYEQDGWLFEHLGVALGGEQRAPKHDHSTMQTNVAGVYVAGTAAAGTQIGGVKVFIETSHAHVERIISSITGSAWRIAGIGAAGETAHADLPES